MLILPLTAAAQTDAIQGFCNRGGQSVTVAGLTSTNKFQNVIAHCSVTVYLTGTTTKATIYADSINTPLANPFTADALTSLTPGKWLFFASNGVGYDVIGSGGDAPNTYPAPVVLCTDCKVGGGGGGAGPTIQTNEVNNASQALLDFKNTATIQALNPSGGIEQFSCVNATNSSIGCLRPDGVTCTVAAGVLTCTPPSGLTIQHNDSAAGINQSNLDFNDTNPAPDAGFESVTFKTDSTGRLAGQVLIPTPAAPSIQMSVTPPVGGQFVILFPSTNVFNGGALSLDNSDWGCEISGASGLILSGACSRTLSGPWVDVNGKTLAQLGIPTGNVTNIYGFTISNFNPGYFSDGSGVAGITGLSCTGLAPTALSNSGLQTAQVTVLSGLVGSGINSATCDVHIQRNSSISTTSSSSILNIYSIGLIVYYTGTPVPAPTALNIAYGLAYNPETNTLLTDPSYPIGQIGVTVADLPSPTGVPPSEYIVKDALTALDCTTGGGSFIHSCLNISGAWTTPLEFNGLLQSMAGICPAGTNGQFTNVSCNFGGAFSDAPTEVKSGHIPSTSPCTATDTFTAGNALVVVLENNSAPPTDASDTFNLVWNATLGGNTMATYIATNIAGGSTTISATGLCNGTYTELDNVKVASPIDGTPVTHTGGTIPASFTVGPLGSLATPTSPNDLIWTSTYTCPSSSTIGLGFKNLGNGSIGVYGNVQSAIGSGIGGGIYQATWTSAPVCVGGSDSAYGIFAIKSAHSGGGGSGTPGGSNGNLQYNNAGAFGGDANTNDDGAGNLTAKSYATNGGSGQGGTIDMTEGTAASAAAGHDLLYADSTTHCVKLSTNGGSFSCIGTGGTVTSVAQTVPAWLAIAGSPITTSGTLAITAATGQTSHQVIGTCNAATSFGPCALVAGDLPAVPLSGLATQAADTVVQNATGGTAVPTAIAMPTCTSGADLYNTSTHSWSCVSTGGSGTTTNPLTMNNSGTGDASGATFNGSASKTISYNTVGASPLAGSTSLVTLGTIATGVWNGTAIGATYGGTGQDSHTATGIAQVASGTWSFSTALANGTTATTQSANDNSTKVATTAYVDTRLRQWACGPGLGDGLNAIAAGTYLQTTCYNTTGSTVTLTGLSCFTDNGGTSTMNASGHTLGSLLTGAVTCTTAFAAGTQSANVLLTSGDYIAFTFVADGTTKQTTWVVKGTY